MDEKDKNKNKNKNASRFGLVLNLDPRFGKVEKNKIK
jgi:hypothetical protein